MSIVFAPSTHQNNWHDTHTTTWVIRPATSSAEDQQYLTAMCYVSIFPMRHPPITSGEESILQRLPQIAPWRRAWGRTGDIALLAIDTITNKRVGAIWCRLFPSAPDFVPGFYHPSVPLVSLAVSPNARHQGIGGSLLDALKQTAAQQGYAALSLAVIAKNPAHSLYLQQGFQPHTQLSASALITMTVHFSTPINPARTRPLRQ